MLSALPDAHGEAHLLGHDHRAETVCPGNDTCRFHRPFLLALTLRRGCLQHLGNYAICTVPPCKHSFFLLRFLENTSIVQKIIEVGFRWQ